MINREITYERNVNRSYMKIPAMQEGNFDETILLKKQIMGLLPVEKCYINGMGQYWYNISGKQALDAYCRVNTVNRTFFENIILRFCEQVEILEWNLIDSNCLVLDPEMVFIGNNGEEVSFVVYPFHRGNLFEEIQQLLEYLLTKLNHEDERAVKEAYAIYELTLSEGLSVGELKKHILDIRMEELVITDTKIKSHKEFMEREHHFANNIEEQESKEEKGWEIKLAAFLDKKLTYIYEKMGKILEKTPFELQKYMTKKQEAIPNIVYPEDKEVVEQIEIHPTICISEEQMEPRGELMCVRRGEYPDFTLDKGVSIIGKNSKVQFRINRDTISQFHARIDYLDKGYYIEDMNSTNGTYVNDILLSYKQRCRLTTGDRVRFADVIYHFY